MSRIATVIMSHPDRDAMTARLAAQLNGPVYVERDDDEDGVWTNARRAWRAGIEDGAPWVLLLQDDIRVCDDFLDHCREISHLGERCVCLHCFDSKRRREAAEKVLGHWMQVRFSTWGQATLLPAAWAQDFILWCDAHVLDGYKHDDTRLTWWLQEQSKSCWVPIPNLVEHLDVPSVLGHPGGETMAFDAKPGDVYWSSGLKDAPVVRGSPIDSRYEYTDLKR